MQKPGFIHFFSGLAEERKRRNNSYITKTNTEKSRNKSSTVVELLLLFFNFFLFFFEGINIFLKMFKQRTIGFEREKEMIFFLCFFVVASDV